MGTGSEVRALRERIAIVSTSYPDHPADPSGHFVETEARALAAAGHEVVVITAGRSPSHGGNPRVVRLDAGGATGWPGVIARLRERPLRAVRLASWTLAARSALAREGRFDRVIAHWLVPGGYPIAHRAAGAARVEVVVHGSDARLLSRLPYPVRHRLFAALEREGTELRCVSQELAALLRTLDRRSSRLRIRVAPAPLGLDGSIERESARLALGIPASARLAVVVGRLIADKRTREALSSASLVPALEIAVVGDGPERAALEAEFPEARFLGFLPRDRTLLWIAAADVLISASKLEGAPTVVREARALGTPVAATSAGDLALWAETDPALFVVS